MSTFFGKVAETASSGKRSREADMSPADAFPGSKAASQQIGQNLEACLAPMCYVFSVRVAGMPPVVAS